MWASIKVRGHPSSPGANICLCSRIRTTNQRSVPSFFRDSVQRSSEAVNSTAPSTTGLVNLAFANIQCLISQKQKTKVQFLHELAQDGDASIIGLVETWLRPSITDSEVHLPGFNLYRADRQCSRNPEFPHGGAAAYVREDLVVSIVEPFSNGFCEVLLISIPTITTSLAIVYRPPGCPPLRFKEGLERMTAFLESQPDSYHNLVMGDFNFPSNIIEWKDGAEAGAVANLKTNNVSASYLLEFAASSFLSQQIMSPTRGESILDLVLVNSPDIVNSVEVTTLPISDHHLISIHTTIPLPHKRGPLPGKEPLPAIGQFNFSKTNWNTLRTTIQEAELTRFIDETGNISSCLSDVVGGLVRCCEAAGVPHRRTPQKSQIPPYRKRLFRQRSRLRACLVRAKSEGRRSKLRDKITEVDTTLKKSIDNERLKEEQEAISQIKINPNRFYTFAQKRSKVKTGIGPLLKSNGQMTTNDSEITEALNRQYISAFSTPSVKDVIKNPKTFFWTDDPKAVCSEKLEDISFTVEEVAATFRSLKAGSAPGPDAIPAVLLKECADQLAPTFHKLFKWSLTTGDIPDSFKVAKITPIHKGGSKQIPKNWRPVALTSHLAKTMEKLIRKALVNHLEKNNLITPDQHGFRAGHSTLSQLLAHTEAILENLENGALVDVVYLDFAKAFDKVDIGVLMHACKRNGVTGRVAQWLYHFLSGRTQFVSANGATSTPVNVLSGVPQGTVLAAVLFLIMMNTIGDGVLNSLLKSYADDTKIMHRICSTKDAEDLQRDLDAVYNWAEQMNMEFNDSKFELLRYGKNQELKAMTGYLASNGSTIEESQSVRDLGIMMASDGSFKEHIEKTVQGASNLCGWILRTFHSREASVMKTLFKSLILSRLDYCSPLILPQSMATVMKIEHVQRAFTRKIEGMTGKNYWERLKSLKMYSLERRRERYSIIYMFKILIGIVPNPNIEFKCNARTGVHATVPLVSATTPAYIKNMKTSAFSYMGPKLFNCLPLNLRSYKPPQTVIDKVGAFKTMLDRYLSLIPDQPTIYGLPRAAASNSIIDQITYISDNINN